ncbi:MAG: ribonuclease H-like domain-containing protein [Candidatus Zixiibacteriota bacterium]
MELEEKLKNLVKLNLKPGKDITPSKGRQRMVEGLDGRMMQNQYGEFVLVEKEFDQDLLQPVIQSASSIKFNGKFLYQICSSRKSIKHQAEDFHFNLPETVFIDCETTGLAGGVGTYAFLVGLGYLDGAKFRVEQYFMQDFHQERAILSAVRERLNRFKFLVSFNGKCYDLPLLECRFLINRMDFEPTRWMHLDLLFPSRRLWKKRIGDCSLGNLEQQILEIKREIDVPGYMIPQIYFDYLRTGETEPLVPVFCHNVHDIVSLFRLSFLIDLMLEDFTSVGIKDPLDLYSLGRVHYKFGNFPASERCYQQALTEELPADWRFTIYLSLAFVYKRTGLWDKASEVWHNLAEGDFSFQPVIYEELAKYYEHRIREYQRALFWVEKAMSLLSSGCSGEADSIHPFSSSRAGKLASWQYRKVRLLRKLERLRARHKVES